MNGEMKGIASYITSTRQCDFSRDPSIEEELMES